MTITVTKTEVRPDTTVEFFNFDTNVNLTSETRQYWYTNFVVTNKCLSTVITFSADLLTRTTVYIWSSLEDFDSFRYDPYIQDNLTAKITAWNSLYGISRDIVIT